uniref:Uncharacterized protein n=1 Tax=Octopus bimaculoides TaxID=37653 RepID=A0A0L8ICD8_OCTBM
MEKKIKTQQKIRKAIFWVFFFSFGISIGMTLVVCLDKIVSVYITTANKSIREQMKSSLFSSSGNLSSECHQHFIPISNTIVNLRETHHHHHYNNQQL